MRIDWAILANGAEARDGLVYVLGGGWDTAYRQTFPATLTAALTVRLLCQVEEATLPHQMSLRFRPASGGEPFASTEAFPLLTNIPDDLPSGWEVPTVVAIGLAGLSIPHAGEFRLEIDVDGTVVKTLPFRVLEQPLPPRTTELRLTATPEPDEARRGTTAEGGDGGDESGAQPPDLG